MQPLGGCLAAGSSPTVPPLPGLPARQFRFFRFPPPSPANRFHEMDEATFSFRARAMFGKTDYRSHFLHTTGAALRKDIAP
ncbi:MAG TPA: hypothetical protein VL462_00670 [Candidatus Nitrosotalea sp.]|jgi:hypothetical protein|nr:hypothetical protein [Candidatus Nitrosotalea sp.]